MASIAKLVVSLGANVAGFETDMARATRNQKKRMREIEQSAAAMGRAVAVAAGAMVGAMALAVKSATEFQAAMAEVSTLLENTSGLDAMSDAVKDLSIQFGQAPVNQAKALYQIISAGASDAATQLEQLTAANKLAVGGITDVATAADGLTTVINAYAEDGLSAQRVSDILFATMRGGKTTINELSQSIGNVATIAAQTGVSFDQVGAAVATLTKAGINTSQSMDALRGVLSAVLKQSDQSVNMAKELGIEFNATALEAKGLHQFLRDIANTGATSEQLSKLFGRVEGLNAVMALASGNGEEFTRQLSAMANSAGETDKAVAKMSETVKFKADQARAAFEVLRIEMGETFLATVGIVAQSFVGSMGEMRGAAKSLGEVFVSVAQSAVLLWGYLKSLATVIIGLANIIIGAFRAIFAPIAAFTQALYEASAALSKGDLKGAYEALSQTVANSGQVFENAIGQITNASEDLKGSNVYFEEAEKLAARMAGGMQNAGEEATALGRAIQSAAPRIAAANKAIKEASNWLGEFEKGAKKGGQSAAEMKKELAQMERAADAATDTMMGYIDELEQMDEEQRRFNESLASLVDTLYPVEAATRTFIQQLEDLRRYADEAGWSAEKLADAEVRLADNFRAATGGIKEQAREVDLLATAIDEGVRIIERSFTDMWKSILDGSDLSSVFDNIFDGFKTLLANMAHQATSQKIILNIQSGLAGQGTGANGGINWAELGTDFAAFGAALIGQSLASNEWGQAGSALGTAFGSAAFEALFPSVFQSLSVFAGPLGTLVGSVLGSLLGNLLGDLFGDDSFNARLGGANTGTGYGRFETAFGPVVGLSSSNFGHFNELDKAGGQIAKAIMDFDQGMYDVLKNLISPDQMEQIVKDLADWEGYWSEANLTVENILGSRFGVILSTFSDEIQAFVRNADDLEGMVERLGVAAAAQKVMAETDIFGEATLDDFMRVVQGFQTGGKTLTEAFQDVLGLLDQVSAVMTSLRDYANSDLAGDFSAMLTSANMTLYEGVADMQAAMMSAIANFDGSTEQLQAIGQMAFTIRQQELNLLSQIDALAKGVAARLQSLRDFVTGADQKELNFGQIVTEAEKLIKAIGTAQTPEEVDRLSQQFDALIRSAPADMLERMSGNFLLLIDQFEQASAGQLESMRQDVLDNAEETRRIVDEFLEKLGPALDVVAGMIPTDPVAQAEMTGQAIADGMSGSLDRQEEIFEIGVGGIRDEVANIGPLIAGALQSGLSGVSVNVTVSEGGLVTQ